MFEILKAYLVEKHGMAQDATEEDVRKQAYSLMAAGTLSHEKYVELTAKNPSGTGASLERLGALIGAGVQKAVEPLVKRLEAVESQAIPAKTSEAIGRIYERAGRDEPAGVSEAEKFIAEGAAKQPAGGVRVKRASESYSHTKSAAVYPKYLNRNDNRPHPFAGEQLTFEGRALDVASQADRALAGAVVKWNLAHQLKQQHKLTDHDVDLFNEAVREGRWCGDFKGPDGFERILYGARLDPAWHKTIFADATSGGTNLVLQVLEDEIIRQAILFGELFPWVDVKPLTKGTSVDTTTLVNLTITSTADEATAMTAQSTASLITKLNSAVRVATGTVKLGRDFLSDITPDIMTAINDSYAEQLQFYLDDNIANGDGTTEPLGIFVAASTTSVSNASPSPSGWDVVDVENMVKGLGKQYRNMGNPSVRWVSNDTTYFRVRGMKVSTTDERRIFGYTHEDYKVMDRGWSIQNSIANAKVAFGDLKKYRLWRRLGMEMIVDESGQALRLENSVLIVVRSRWAGRPVLPQAFAVMTNAQA